MHMSTLPTCMSVHRVWAVPLEEKGFAGAPGTGVAGGYELSCGFSEFNLGPLKEQLVLLILRRVSSHQNVILLKPENNFA